MSMKTFGWKVSDKQAILNEWDGFGNFWFPLHPNTVWFIPTVLPRIVRFCLMFLDHLFPLVIISGSLVQMSKHAPAQMLRSHPLYR